MKLKHLVYLIVFALSAWACKDEKKKVVIDYAELEEQLIESHKANTTKEDELIEAYLKKKELTQMVKTGTGLRYWIYEQGNGAVPVPEDIVNIHYRISLLNDTLCYESGESPITMRVDHDDFPSGMHEGLKLMPAGSKALFILPSRLAYGISGDQNKVPRNASLVCDIELLENQ